MLFPLLIVNIIFILLITAFVSLCFEPMIPIKWDLYLKENSYVLLNPKVDMIVGWFYFSLSLFYLDFNEIHRYEYNSTGFTNTLMYIWY